MGQDAPGHVGAYQRWRSDADVEVMVAAKTLRLGQVSVLDAAKPVVTFKDYAEHWLETVGSVRLRPASVEQYQLRLRLRLLPTLWPLPMASITRETVRNLLSEMVKAGNHRSKGRPAARGTIQASLRTPVPSSPPPRTTGSCP